MKRWIVIPMMTLMISLLLVGVVSGTVLRHGIQIVPAALVLAAGTMGRRWSASASIPIFLIWLGIMGMIWCTITGLAPLAPGTYTPVEVFLTVVMGLACVAGLFASVRRGALVFLPGLGIFLLFAVLQILALWISFQTIFAYD